MCSGIGDQGQNPHPDHGLPFWGWHAGYPSGVYKKIWKVAFHRNLCKYFHNILCLIKKREEQANLEQMSEIFTDVVYRETHRETTRNSCSSSVEAVIEKKAMSAACVSVSALTVCTIQAASLHAMPMLSMQCFDYKNLILITYCFFSIWIGFFITCVTFSGYELNIYGQTIYLFNIIFKRYIF